MVAEEKRELLCKLILASFDLGFKSKVWTRGWGGRGWLGLGWQVSYM